ncbi:MAG: alkylmercury lyase family protein [Candidatus Odinarchaeota archaeon]
MNDRVIKPEATERTKIIFQEACSVENMDAKLGRTLEEEENAIRRFILSQTPVLGRIPAIDEIKEAFNHISAENVNAILIKLDQLDVIHLDEDRSAIAAAYPFSGTETSHVITLKKDGQERLHAMCAIDALGISFMLERDTVIESKCYHCEDRVEIEISNGEIVILKPETAVVWCDMEYSCNAATSLCKNINFFSSGHHFAEWQEKRPRRNGHLLSMEEAFYLGKLFFENRLNS